MGIFQPWHLVIVLVIVLLVFGPGKLPELGKALGDGMRELKNSTSDGGHTATTAATTTLVAAAPSAPVMPATAACTNPQCRAAVPVGAQFCGVCGTRAHAGELIVTR